MDSAAVHRSRYGIRSAIIGFIAGAVLATLVQYLIILIIGSFSPLPLTLGVTVLMALIMICLVIISTTIVDAQNNSEELWAKIDANIRKLTAQDISVRYFEEGERGEHDVHVFEQITNVVRSATTSILILTSPIMENGPEDNQDSIAARNQYYEAIVERIQQGVEYRRIFQLQKGMTLRDLHLSREYIEHFGQVLDLLDNKPKLRSTTSIQYASATRFISFVLVDGHHLVWQIEHLPGSEVTQMQLDGLFIVDDMRGETSSLFRKIFDSMRGIVMGTLTHDDLTL